MLFLLNALCTNTDYTQNKEHIRNHTLDIADCFQAKQICVFFSLFWHDDDLTYHLKPQYNLVEL